MTSEFMYFSVEDFDSIILGGQLILATNLSINDVGTFSEYFPSGIIPSLSTFYMYPSGLVLVLVHCR